MTAPTELGGRRPVPRTWHQRSSRPTAQRDPIHGNEVTLEARNLGWQAARDDMHMRMRRFTVLTIDVVSIVLGAGEGFSGGVRMLTGSPILSRLPESSKVSGLRRYRLK
jgi:hypothetical protein